ncbi:LysM peptidoglycan-binding domain-containing protein [Aureitalea sp. L0-47]|uniref:amino acid ABC transporter substrate-binding protein n=1 Tax=Aureitalea sp. L0-47 TaxID=2816962 RepID=UPI002239000C|nr:LysM peptidoglycan-binding domain-containing protein [Aureitalea sp. L0-47]MCW5520301.1 LysM peptidoglycan-binding domain-containing protein [Aureitalea sp. L0-47]
MRKFIFFILVIIGSVSVAPTYGQEYRTHEVKAGETIYSISKQYGVTEQAIYALNPDAKNGLRSNTVLIIPSESTAAVQEKVTFKKHRVKRKETLFSIAQRYNITVDDLKKYNKELYSRPLKKGERIQIPIIEIVPTDNTSVTNIETNTSNKGKHTVQPKETKYGIARKYGITIAELETLNPMIGENLQIGTVLNVPKDPVMESATIEDENFEFYEVLPKEGFFRLKVKLGLSQEEIIALNPYAEAGLKEGMILKIPKESASDDGSKTVIVNLEDGISNYKKKKIAVMLPFQLTKSDRDSLKNNADLIRDNGALRVALDFYSGVLLAAEFAKDKGISVEIDVYDTEGKLDKVSSIISRNDFSDVDAVIGPLLRRNVERAASELKRTDTPIFSPLSNREIKISANLFQTLPSDEMLQKAMLEYLRDNSEGKNIIIISDSKKASQKAALLSAMPGAKALTPREKGFFYDTDISSKLDATRENWVILESVDPVIVANVVGLLNGMPDTVTIRLFTLDKNDAYNYHDVSNLHLAKLNFTFPSVSKSYNYKDKNAFLVSYKNKYNVLPNRFAVRGFDVAYDILLRLAVADDVYDANDPKVETEYIENKFRYTKKMFSGYQNNALYIIKYNQDLQFEVVE